MEKALFGAGCFWGVEETFRNTPGVIDTEVGYSGGHYENPSYEHVCSGDTNHAEVVKINFDENKITYKKLLDVFWNCHDPSTLNRQGYDIGTQYRSVIYYYNDDQMNIALESKRNTAISKNINIVTEISKAKEFFKAEEYHQKYIQKTGRHCAI